MVGWSKDAEIYHVMPGCRGNALTLSMNTGKKIARENYDVKLNYDIKLKFH